jgi:hypothetical protein
MSEETKRQFIEIWMRSLAESARGLDFSDPDDRATFRGLVQHSMRNLTWEGMRRIAQHLGADKVGRSRDAAWRALTTLYIQRDQTPKNARHLRSAGSAMIKPLRPLAPEMLRVLRIAERDGGSVSAGSGAYKGRVERVPASTISALIRRGLLEHRYGSEGGLGGRLTEAGRAALAREAAPKKTPSQLDAEIAETLAKEQRPPVLRLLTKGKP